MRTERSRSDDAESFLLQILILYFCKIGFLALFRLTMVNQNLILSNVPKLNVGTQLCQKYSWQVYF